MDSRKYIVCVPNFPMKIQVSNSRRATYYKEGESLPLKYQTDEYGYLSGRLVDKSTKKPVIRNAKVAGKPNFVAISGNSLYKGMHERVRIAIINGIKEAFLPHLPPISVGDVLKYPVHVHMRLYRTIGDGNWDVDNFVILYFKAFHDLLTEQGKIPDDSIRYISGTSNDFHPIASDDDRKMVFSLTTDDRPVIKMQRFYDDWVHEITTGSAEWSIVVSEKASAGELLTDYDACTFLIGIGKKHVLWNAVRKVLSGIAKYAINMNIDIQISKEFDSMFRSMLIEKFSKQSIRVRINPDMKTSEWVMNLFNNTKDDSYESK